MRLGSFGFSHIHFCSLIGPLKRCELSGRSLEKETVQRLLILDESAPKSRSSGVLFYVGNSGVAI